jgi:hypothetical protein
LLQAIVIVLHDGEWSRRVAAHSAYQLEVGDDVSGESLLEIIARARLQTAAEKFFITPL